MELINSGKRAMSTLTTTRGIEVPAQYSREKVLKYLNAHGDVYGCAVHAVPSREANNLMYRLHMKIGATGQLPSNTADAESYLNDFWVDLYLKNNRCPGNIPFHIIITEFTSYLVQNDKVLKGHNQKEICRAFNNWITQEKVRHTLYSIRDRMYPAKKPKQIAEKAKEKELKDFTLKELEYQLKETEKVIDHFKGLKFPKEWKAKLEAEISRRTNNKK